MASAVRPAFCTTWLRLVIAAMAVVGLDESTLAQDARARPSDRPPPTLRDWRRPAENWQMLDVHAGARQFRALGFDGHVHSAVSRDAVHPIADLMWLAEQVDLDLLLLTDHGSTAAASWLDRAYPGPVAVVIGQEVGGPFGHVVLWNLRDRAGIGPAARVGLSELGALVHRAGGLVVLAHPGWWITPNRYDPRRWMQYDALRRGGIGAEIDALELWNQVYWQESRALVDEWVALLERGLYVPIVGNSDFHRAVSHELGRPRNVILCEARADGSLATSLTTCVLDAVRAGRLYVTDGPSIDLRIGSRVLGEVVEALPSTLLAVDVRALAPEGGTLRVFLGRQVVEEVALEPGVEARRSLVVPVPTQDSFVRAEILRPRDEPDRPPFSLVSNPVRIDVLPLREDGWRGPDEGVVPAPRGFSRRDVDRREFARRARRVRRGNSRASFPSPRSVPNGGFRAAPGDRTRRSW